MSYLERVQACNRLSFAGLRPFRVNGDAYGWITADRAAVLARCLEVFTVTPDAVTMAHGLDTPAARSAAIAALAPVFADSGLYARLRGELYAIKNTWSATPAFTLDRALVSGFGARAYGVHVNGYVRRADGIHLWIGTRAADREVEPGKLDNMVAGGQPAGMTLMDNVIKECGEEADLGPDLARTARPVGALSYAFSTANGVKADTLFCYDLELPADVIPRNTDGEIARFELMPLGDVLALIRDTDRFKFNVNLVILDFAIRHGVLNPDAEPDFEAILAGLHRPPEPNLSAINK